MKKLVFVTGSGRGIGQAIALKLISEGYEVAGCARSQKELEDTKSLSQGRLRIATVDVTNTEALEKWISSEIDSSKAIPYGLVTAAGVLGPIGPLIDNDLEEWKKCVEINLYGTVFACQIFAKHMVSLNKPGRIALLSGGGATKPMTNLTGYSATKAAVVRFGETLAKELEKYQITVNSIAPGLVASRIHEEVLKVGLEKAGPEAFDGAVKQKEGKGESPEKAANLISYLFSESAQNITGRLISAVWDPWDQFHTWSPEYQKSDLYTLRRIVPEDRDL